MAERYQRANGQDNNSSTASDSGTSTDWDGCRGNGKNAQLVEEKVTTQETAELNGTMNFGAPGAIETITATTLADWPPCRSSTPRYMGNYHPHPSPRTGDDHTVPPVEPHFSTRPSPMIASQGTGNLELSQMLQTILRENNEEAKLKQQQKNLMANIPTFDGKDKKACLMWVNHVEHTAKQARMTFREAVASKAGPTVVNSHLKVILMLLTLNSKRNHPRKAFSNVGTRTEASPLPENDAIRQ